ncbi:TPA_exp: Uncharacterized protein A8136_0749 [Trichophyton benhamiae CBS 112371]|uniref:Uncharacterized protein n=1 Tax=Arthroderma benhamiae (strain ATCC MYA-4681 / CBS 112371) TaxID=663331 RepID=D4AUD3_ARTBC|nr:uncharacterized protein ARB_07763 [Trichophyton benhamiae CBS 112371]EFE33403.1 conserved hypothetical protein [Trichophyton benhamiae CBS 112371]DAA76435.1 TPA_exp: Uncharacterized protein A8136_0749 [Trichophyton benhamiae CBS 112371]
MDCPEGNCVIPSLTREEKRKRFGHDPANSQETWEGLRNNIYSIGRSYIDNHCTAAETESRLHDLWDELIHVAKVTPAHSPEHDRLVILILEARELGSFPINQKDRDALPGTRVCEVATMPNGQRLWVDLPYLVQAIYAVWTKESMKFSSQERQSLAVLTAKLCAVGVCPDQLSRCALWLFRESLETARDGVPLPSKPEDGSNTIVELLPACLEWLKQSSHKLVKLSLADYDPATGLAADLNDSLTAPGELAVKSNIKQPGFSLPRWLFWRQRFKDLYRCRHEPLVSMARACFDASIFSGLNTGLTVPGEQIYLDRLFQALDKELAARGNKDSVDASEIEIDMDWDKE